MAGAVTVGIAIVTVSLIEGTPNQLPGVALASPVLLHAERALALPAVTAAALSILAQAARGRLPIELSTSGLRYEPEAADDAAAAAADLQEQLDDLGRQQAPREGARSDPTRTLGARTGPTVSVRPPYE